MVGNHGLAASLRLCALGRRLTDAVNDGRDQVRDRVHNGQMVFRIEVQALSANTG